VRECAGCFVDEDLVAAGRTQRVGLGFGVLIAELAAAIRSSAAAIASSALNSLRRVRPASRAAADPTRRG